MDDVWAHPFFADIRRWQRQYGYREANEPCPDRGNWLAPCLIRDHHATFLEMVRHHEPSPTDEDARTALSEPPRVPLETKRRAVEACRRSGIRICLVPTIVKGVNDDQVGPIFRFALENSDVINAIAYQPVAFTGRIARHELEARRYTVGDLASAIGARTATCSS